MTDMVATGAFTPTASDSTDLTQPARALFIGTTGNVAVSVSRGGPSVLFKNLPSGSILPVQVFRVWSTGTTATDLVALL